MIATVHTCNVNYEKVKLLDCPGIVFDDSDAGATLLRNCVNAEAMEDPTPSVAAVLRRCPPEQLMQVIHMTYSQLRSV